MSIQLKFILLLALLGSVVAISIGSAAWAVSVIYTQAQQNFENRSMILKGLVEIEKSLEPQRRVLEEADRPVPPVPAGPDRPKSIPWFTMSPESVVTSVSAGMDEDLAALERVPTFRREVGYSTSANLRRRIDQYRAHIGEWLQGRTPEKTGKLVADLRDIEELIEHINHRILEGATADIGNLRELRARVGAVLMFAVVATVLAGVLGVLLVRRWVSRPVALLRAATGRIAAGDFAHRVPAHGRDEIAALGRDVNHMAATVAQLQEERIETERLAAVGEVLRRLVHNLRNPLAGIRGLAELSRSEAEPGSDLREQQDRIVKTVDRFERWLSELLSVTRPLAVDPSPQDVSAWLPPVVETLRPRAEGRGVSLEVGLPASRLIAEFDPRHLEQAVVAAVANAIEVSSPGSAVRVDAEVHTDTWFLRIADQGPGIPLHLQDQVFKPYFTTKPDGNGIGLAVVQQVVRAHGGRVLLGPGLGAHLGAQSPHSGVTVSLTLPLAIPRAGGNLSS